MTKLIDRLRIKSDEIEQMDHTESRAVLIKLLREAANKIEEIEAELVHSEWLRMRQGSAYQRLGEDFV